MGARISINKLCRGCMSVLDIEDGKCRLCGFDRQDYTIVRDHLRLDCILKGKYLVGACLKDTDRCKTYIGWNLSYDTKVVITEFFPNELVKREDHESGQVIVKKNVLLDTYKKNINKFITKAELIAFSPDKPVNITETFQENGTAYYIVECLEESEEKGKEEVKAISEYVLLQASDLEQAEPSQDMGDNGSGQAGEPVTGYVRQQLYHVQPARSERQGTIVKNVASNVLSGASVSYEKTTRIKQQGVQYVDIELNDKELSDTSGLGGNNNSQSLISFSQNNAKNISQGEEYESGMSGMAASGLKGKIIANKTMIIALVMICVFVGIALKLAFTGDKDGEDPVTTIAVSTTAAPTVNNESTPTPEAEPVGDLFEFSDKGGVLEQAVCKQLGVDADKLTVETVESVKELKLDGIGATDVTDLKYFKNLTDLDISGNPVESLNAIVKLKKLERLNIRKCGFKDVSKLNKMKKLKWVNVSGDDELVDQLPDIDYVVGRREYVTVNVKYIREDKNYDNWSIWMWTDRDPGSEVVFEDNGDGTASISRTYLLTTDNSIGFKLKYGEWEETDEISEDRKFDCEINKKGTVLNVTIKENIEDVTVEYETE